MRARSAEELAKALKENDWTSSKTTDKTMAIMIGMDSIPWEKVKLFTMRWETVNSEIVPVINIMMRPHNYDETEDHDMKEFDVESLMDEEEE